MPTPYEEISKSYASKEMHKTDANLAQDSMQLGGIDAEEYATKDFVKQVEEANSKKDHEYTNEQIKAAKEASNSYTDKAIQNIDYGDFATKNDINVVNQKTETNEDNIENLKKEVNELDAKDVSLNNDKFTSENVHDGMTELFTSVSDGKTKVASAITDKGVTTASNESFDTMANNIRDIDTLGEGTADATATAGDVKLGKTAYAKGKKITGTAQTVSPDMPNILDTSDATALASDIKSGKTAYARGEKITGIASSVEPDGMNILDTSDATATADDIRIGKSAYVKGNKVIGTYAGSTGQDVSYGVTGGNITIVEEVTPIYQNVLGEFEYIEMQNSIASVTSGIHAVTRDGNYYAVIRTISGKQCITICTPYYSDITQTLELLIRDDYTFENIGIPNDASVKCMTFGAFGYAGYQNSCLLAIAWTTSAKKNLSLIHFNAYGAGELMCTHGNSVPYFEIDISGGNPSHMYHYFPQHIAMARHNPYICAVTTDDPGYASWQEIFKAYAYSGEISSIDRRALSFNYYPDSLRFECNDRLLVSRTAASRAYGNARTNISILNAEYKPTTVINEQFPAGLTPGHGNYFNSVYSPDGVYALHSTYDTLRTLVKVAITDTGITYKELGNVDIGIDIVSYNAWFSSDNTTLIVDEYNTGKLKVYKVDLTGSSAFELIEEYTLSSNFALSDNLDGTGWFTMNLSGSNGRFSAYKQTVDGTSIVGIIWRGNKYFQLTPESYTAQSSDVRLGRTFIGSRGIVEVGAATIAGSTEG